MKIILVTLALLSVFKSNIMLKENSRKLEASNESGLTFSYIVEFIIFLKSELAKPENYEKKLDKKNNEKFYLHLDLNFIKNLMESAFKNKEYVEINRNEKFHLLQLADLALEKYPIYNKLITENELAKVQSNSTEITIKRILEFFSIKFNMPKIKVLYKILIYDLSNKLYQKNRDNFKLIYDKMTYVKENKLKENLEHIKDILLEMKNNNNKSFVNNELNFIAINYYYFYNKLNLEKYSNLDYENEVESSDIKNLFNGIRFNTEYNKLYEKIKLTLNNLLHDNRKYDLYFSYFDNIKSNINEFYKFLTEEQLEGLNINKFIKELKNIVLEKFRKIIIENNNKDVKVMKSNLNDNLNDHIKKYTNKNILSIDFNKFYALDNRLSEFDVSEENKKVILKNYFEYMQFFYENNKKLEDSKIQKNKLETKINELEKHIKDNNLTMPRNKYVKEKKSKEKDLEELTNEIKVLEDKNKKISDNFVNETLKLEYNMDIKLNKNEILNEDYCKNLNNIDVNFKLFEFNEELKDISNINEFFKKIINNNNTNSYFNYNLNILPDVLVDDESKNLLDRCNNYVNTIKTKLSNIRNLSLQMRAFVNILKIYINISWSMYRKLFNNYNSFIAELKKQINTNDFSHKLSLQFNKELVDFTIYGNSHNEIDIINAKEKMNDYIGKAEFEIKKLKDVLYHEINSFFELLKNYTNEFTNEFLNNDTEVSHELFTVNYNIILNNMDRYFKMFNGHDIKINGSFLKNIFKYNLSNTDIFENNDNKKIVINTLIKHLDDSSNKYSYFENVKLVEVEKFCKNIDTYKIVFNSIKDDLCENKDNVLKHIKKYNITDDFEQVNFCAYDYNRNIGPIFYNYNHKNINNLNFNSIFFKNIYNNGCTNIENNNVSTYNTNNTTILGKVNNLSEYNIVKDQIILLNKIKAIKPTDENKEYIYDISPEFKLLYGILYNLNEIDINNIKLKTPVAENQQLKDVNDNDNTVLGS